MLLLRKIKTQIASIYVLMQIMGACTGVIIANTTIYRFPELPIKFSNEKSFWPFLKIK